MEKINALGWKASAFDQELFGVALDKSTVNAKVGNSKAPGLDGVPTIALTAAIEKAPEMFLSMYNRCLQEGIFPTK